MKRMMWLTVTFCALGLASSAHAQAMTGTCKDGTKTSAATKVGACSGHGGVKDWIGPAGAPAGAPTKVWVNVPTKIYHCPGTQFYGKTKDGKYMTEDEAMKMGAKPNSGKPCPKSPVTK